MLPWPSVVRLWNSSSECQRFVIESLIVDTVLVFLLADICWNVYQSEMLFCLAALLKYGIHFAFFAWLMWQHL